jgi:hypothetical protein
VRRVALFDAVEEVFDWMEVAVVGADALITVAAFESLVSLVGVIEDVYDFDATVEAQVVLVDVVEDVDDALALGLVPAANLASRSPPRPSTMISTLELFFRKLMR